jgi:hypothetical protein
LSGFPDSDRACKRKRRRDCADIRSCARDDERRRLTRSAKIGSYVPDNLMLTAEPQAGEET